MHGRVAIYTFSGDAHDLARRAESGLMPIFKAQPGFKAYSVLESDGTIISFSAWDSAASAEAASSMAADWVAENIGDEMTLERSAVGEVLFSTTLGVSALEGVKA
jgi:heme-degrading monooxygenase HmoA